MPLVIGGRTAKGPKQGLLVIPRDDGDFVFRFTAIVDDSPFDKLYPMPKPPRVKDIKSGETVDNFNDQAFRATMEDRGIIRQDWFFLTSIAPSEIQWNGVKLDDYHTFHLWREELKDAGFSVKETEAIWNKFLETNLVTDAMLNEARSRFLATEAEAKSSAGQ